MRDQSTAIDAAANRSAVPAVGQEVGRKRPVRGFGSVTFLALPGGGMVPADTAREVWDSGLCAQVDPELFFPEKGGTAAPAKAVCAACPVTALCLVTFGPLVASGVVGGLTASERSAAGRQSAADEEAA